MHPARLSAPGLRRWLVPLLLPALAFRLLLPEGFMPQIGGDHALSIQMCHGDSRSSLVMRLTQSAPTVPGNEGGERHDAACVFAAAGTVAAPAPAVVVAGPAMPPATTLLPAASAPVLRHPHPPQSTRAPPPPAQVR